MVTKAPEAVTNINPHNLAVPTVHLNGTSKERLLEQIEDAYSALSGAYLKMREMTPNARDYYLQGAGATEKAQTEHMARLQKLTDIQKELTDLSEAIDAQGRR